MLAWLLVLGCLCFSSHTSCNLELLGSFSSSYKPVAHCVPYWLGLGTYPPELHLTTPHYGQGRIGCGVPGF